ncbi:MAG: hypothetical protein IJA45_03485 [Oscillospiraceae bacterium]|nr:hypothetical protein [Oscillospiraceae bacterium]
MKRPQLKDLTLREKVGQTVCVRENLLTNIPDLSEYLKKYPYGCIWAMGNQLNDTENMGEETNKNGKATGKAYLKTTKKLMAATKIPVLMVGNTESGFSSVFPELTHNMGQMAVSATNDEALIYEQAAAIAREMKASGVQWKWSPNIDTDDLHGYSAYGRAYSGDPDQIIRCAIAAVRGTQSEGVAVSVKHFPGKDGVDYRDSHFASTFNMQTREEWEKTNGYIYREIIRESDPWAIMVGHQGLPCVDNTKMPNGTFIPSTLSYKILTELLKGELGYKGVVITDAIGMGALYTHMPESELYVHLLLAGNDMILGPTPQATDDYIDYVEQAVLDGRIPESRIDDACERVLQMKEKLGMFQEDFGLDLEITPELLAKTHEIEASAARKAITLVRDDGMLPLKKENLHKVLIAPVSYWPEFDEAIHHTGKLLEAKGIQVDYMLPTEVDKWAYVKTMVDMEQYDLVLCGSYLRAHRPAGVPGYNHWHQRFLQFLQTYANNKLVAVAYGSPHIYFDYFTNTGKAFIAAYDYTKELQEAVVDALFGEIPFQGKCPFTLIPDWFVNNPFL